ncbi:hypothetical protein Btru_021374 [Bulinus truncatus]|nr:hypothetical protein Btru_021374 [Bulinus truncatus]
MLRYNCNRKTKMPVSTYYIDNNLDEYDFMSMDVHKHIRSAHSGKGRSKKEARTNTNRFDPKIIYLKFNVPNIFLSGNEFYTHPGLAILQNSHKTGPI